jgi:hypothetical protein
LGGFIYRPLRPFKRAAELGHEPFITIDSTAEAPEIKAHCAGCEDWGFAAPFSDENEALAHAGFDAHARKVVADDASATGRKGHWRKRTSFPQGVIVISMTREGTHSARAGSRRAAGMRQAVGQFMGHLGALLLNLCFC